MNLKQYKMRITTKSPIFIGDKNQYMKKEYLYIPNEKRVIIPDISKLYAELKQRGYDRAFEEFMMSHKSEGLYDFLNRNTLLRSLNINSYKKYEYTTNNIHLDKSGLKEIHCFIKDPYGKPYIPGSSIKGAIRTALLSYIVRDQGYEQYGKIDEVLSDVWDITYDDDNKDKRERYLKNEIEKIETFAFHRLKKKNDEEKDLKNAVNSIMQGMVISDSSPLELSDLILAQKTDVSLNKPRKMQSHTLPFYMEMLKPEVTIDFTMNIDEDVLKMDINSIFRALDEFNEISNHAFYSRFKRENQFKNTLFLGGSVGFLSKTIVYPAFEGVDESGLNYDSAVEVADKIMYKTLGENIYYEHKHDMDVNQSLSPHICKCVDYNGTLYNTGVCTLSMLKEEVVR